MIVKRAIVATVLATAASVSSGADSAHTSQNFLAVAGAQKLVQMTNDRKSFELDQALAMDGGAVCYEYRARNALGGMVRGQAVATGEKIITSSDRSGAFSKSWNRSCGGKSGRDVTSLVKRNL